MALRFHAGVQLLGQSRASSKLASSLPAVTTRSAPFKLCSPPLRVRCAAASRGSEAQSVTNRERYDDKEFPPLVASLAIPGLPPCRESVYVDEASAIVGKLWPSTWKELETFYHAFVSFISFLHPGSVSADRLAVIATGCTQSVILDDVLFDSPNAFLAEKLGIDLDILGKPEELERFFHELDVLIRQEEPPQHPTPIQEMTWRFGSDLRRLSNPEWFDLFAQAVLDQYLGALASFRADLEGDQQGSTDVDSITQMRIEMIGRLENLGLEFLHNQFLPTEVRERPEVKKLSLAHSKWSTYVNDIFSFSKEQDEANAPNLLKVIMESEGLSLPQAAWRAVNLINSLAGEILELEAQLLAGEVDPALRCYLRATKECMTGTTYWYSMVKRYRHPQAPFAELRDVNVSFFPKAEPYEFGFVHSK
jgi:hypothetical protein